MKHATSAALSRIDGLLAALRSRAMLREKKPGVFYRSSKAFVHFHEDPAGLFADIRIGDDWERVDVTTPTGHKKLLALVDSVR